MFKPLANWIGNRSWWFVFLGWPGLILVASIMFGLAAASFKIENQFDDPAVRAAVKKEIESIQAEYALGAVKVGLSKAKDFVPDEETKAELDKAIREVEKEIDEANSAEQKPSTPTPSTQEKQERIEEQIKELTQGIRSKLEKIESTTPSATEIQTLRKEINRSERKLRQLERDLRRLTRSTPIKDLAVLSSSFPTNPLPPEIRAKIRERVQLQGRVAVIGGIVILILVLLFPVLIIAKFAISAQRSLKRRAEKSQAEAEQNLLGKQLMEAKLAAMQAQIEPHFLFNTLASVQQLIETDPAAAAKMQANLIKYLRAAIPQMRDKSTTIGQEVELIRAYLNIQKMRMEERLSFSFDIPAALENTHIPPMMLLTLVENAIKHGLEPKTDGGTIAVSADRDDAKLRITVTDSGVGFSATPGEGVGLKNIRDRLQALYGPQASLIIEPNEPVGAKITLEIPYGQSFDR